MIAIAFYVWAFVKEIFAGKKLHDPYAKENSDNLTPASLVSKLLTSMQESRRILACICLLLILSLFVNYRTISKLVVISRANEELVGPNGVQPAVQNTPIEFVPKEPKGAVTTMEDTVDFLEQLYGGK